jgi:hypothetical protein
MTIMFREHKRIKFAGANPDSKDLSQRCRGSRGRREAGRPKISRKGAKWNAKTPGREALKNVERRESRVESQRRPGGLDSPVWRSATSDT